MDRKNRNVILLVVAYCLVLVIGFRSGEIYNRMKKGYKAEGIVVPAQGSYVVVESATTGRIDIPIFPSAAPTMC